MTALVLRADALNQPLADESVDLIITSPPYFALRSYQDGGEHYDGQLGSEPTPEAFLEALWAVMAECWRVLKPSGSCWVNLGDKYAGSGGHNNAGVTGGPSKLASAKYVDRLHEQAKTATRRDAPNNYNKASGGVRVKSLMGLPWRFTIGCIDGQAAPEGQQWILRAELVWQKPNGLPESVRDRVRRSHEQWFHFVKSPTYFAGIDEVREAQSDPTRSNQNVERMGRKDGQRGDLIPSWGKVTREYNPLGKLPGSVWSIPSEPLILPDDLGLDHFAAFPTEWPRRIILGWSPTGICTACGEGRVPVVVRELIESSRNVAPVRYGGGRSEMGGSWTALQDRQGFNQATITGYACACPEPTAPTRPAVVLDPFGGTGTVAMVAKALGRQGISIDLSADYCRIAEWRTNDAVSLQTIRAKTYGVKRPKRVKRHPDQASFF